TATRGSRIPTDRYEAKVRPEQSYLSGPSAAHSYGLPSWLTANATAFWAAAPATSPLTAVLTLRLAACARSDVAAAQLTAAVWSALRALSTESAAWARWNCSLRTAYRPEISLSTRIDASSCARASASARCAAASSAARVSSSGWMAAPGTADS